MERDFASLFVTICRLNFNSHAHVERDYFHCENVAENCISTHTLTWSVTNPKLGTNMYKFISTHTLTWSVTYVRLDTAKIDSSISTHTLTWSVTRSSTVISYCNSNFNSHAHVERDPPMQRIV